MNRQDNIKIMLEQDKETRIWDKNRNSTTKYMNSDAHINALRNPNTNLWFLRYDPPVSTPITLQQQFTNFGALLKFAENYFSRRNIKIKEIID